MANWSSPYQTDFCIDASIYIPPPPPVNDECSGAISLTVNNDLNCGTVSSGAVTGATPSSQDQSACSGTEDDDVWYTFVATSTSHQVSILNVAGSTSDMYHSVWKGTCPGSLSLVSGTCSDADLQTVSGLIISNTYYVRVYTYTSTTGQTSTFDICIGTPPPPPPHDECGGAISVALGTTLSTEINTPSVYEATNSGITSCVGNEDDDVWYSFTAPSSGTVDIAISNATGTTDLTHEVFSGSCGSLTSMTCSDPNTSITGGLTAGATYFVRVYTYSSSGDNTGFDIDITAGPSGGVTCYTQSNPSWSALVNGSFSVKPSDDEFGPARGILFNFCFMGNVFTNMYVSSNGYISFDAANANGGSTYVPRTLPSTHSQLLNSIMSPHHDINAQVAGDIRKRNVGVAPNRSVEIIYNNVGYFGSSCTAYTARHQIILYETSNVIDIKIENKPVCTGWNGGDATMGLNGPLGLASVNVAGRNDQNWTANNEVTRFIPSCDVCPIGLGSDFSYFDVQNKGGINEIVFATSSEENMNYFEIQRSTDAIHYETIKTMKSVYGNSTSETAYNFIDKKPVTGVNYYRVKSIDLDGKYSFTSMKKATVGLENKPKIYPNPTTDVVYVEYFNVVNNDVVFELMNLSGQTVMKKTISNSKGFNKSMIDVNTLEKGVYFYKMFINNSIETGKLIVK